MKNATFSLPFFVCSVIMKHLFYARHPRERHSEGDTRESLRMLIQTRQAFHISGINSS